MKRLPAIALAAATMIAGSVACSGHGGTNAKSSIVVRVDAFDPHAVPTGPVGDAIKYGRQIIVATRAEMKGYVTADMSCAACHLDGGTKARGGTLVGTYARFPQWNKRSKRVITLQDRLAECFLYSMNGRPPAYNSKAMIAMVAYIAYLSRDVPTGSKAPASGGFIVPLPQGTPDVAAGAKRYAQKCQMCHQANGAGVSGTFPPLWGPTSFNDGAGMSHLNRMTGFVHYNMPANAPGTLSVREAYDISGYVLSHGRPHFQRTRAVTFPSQPASSF